MPIAYQIAALRGMLTGKYNDHIHMKVAVREYDMDELRTEVRRYATLKTVNRGKRGSHMNIDTRETQIAMGPGMHP